MPTSVNDIKAGDILLVSHPKREDTFIHALFCSGERPLDYPVDGITVVHAVKVTGMVFIHTLTFYMENTFEGSKLYIFRPKNLELGKIAFEILTHWFRLGVYFDPRVELTQKINIPGVPREAYLSSTFNPLRAVKQNLLGSYSTINNLEFTPGLTQPPPERGVTCHSLIMDAFNLASLKLTNILLADDEVPHFSKLNKGGQLNEHVQSTVSKNSLHGKKRGHSPLNFLNFAQRTLFEKNGSAFKMPFPINPKYSHIGDFSRCLINSDAFTLIMRLEREEAIQGSISKAEYVEMINPWVLKLDETRKGLRGEMITSYMQNEKLRQEYIETRTAAVDLFNQKKYEECISKLSQLSKETIACQLPVEKAGHYYILARCYEETESIQEAHDHFIHAQKIYLTFLGKHHKQVTKVDDKIASMKEKLDFAEQGQSSLHRLRI